MKKIRSFPLRLSLNILLFVSILFIIALGIVAVSSHQLIATEATKATEYRLHAMIKEIELPLVEVELSTRSAAQILAAMHGDAKVAESIKEKMVSQTAGVSSCCVLVGHSLPSKPMWSSPHRNNEGDLVATYSYPVTATEGGSVLVVATDVSVGWIEEKLQSIRPYKNSYASILCPDGSIIGVQDTLVAVAVQERIAKDTAANKVYSSMLKGDDSMLSFFDGRKAVFMVYAPLRMGWSASIVCQYKDVLEQSSKMHIILFFIGLIGLLILFLLCYFIVRRVTHPIVELTSAARTMSHGNLSVPLPDVKSHDEVLQLRDAFAFMQQSLTEYIEELKTTTAANNRMEGELSVASDIQMGMLCRDFPQQLYAKLIPAKEVGGDLYDFVLRDNGILYFAVGDVSGKGAPAALMMSITRAALHFVAGMDLPMDQVMQRVNRSIVDANSSDMFVTLFVGRINLATGELQYCNGGHNPIMVIPPDAEPYYLKAKPNLALGVMPDFLYVSEHLSLPQGTRLLLYTDGISEAERSDRQQYGEERLHAWVSTQGTHGTEQAFVEALYESVKEFVAGNPPSDDITIMSIKI